MQGKTTPNGGRTVMSEPAPKKAAPKPPTKPKPKPKAAAAPKKPAGGFSSDLKALAAKERAGIAAQRAAAKTKAKPAAKKATNRGYDSYKKLMG
jgi:hypothetical protein